MKPLVTTLSVLALAATFAAAGAQELPIDQETLEKRYTEVPVYRVRNLLSLEQVWEAVQSGKDGLVLDFSHVTRLLDGTEVRPDTIYGRAAAGPYPFEAEETAYAYKRFRKDSDIENGRGVLYVGDFFRDKYNSEGWTDSGQVAIRMTLYAEQAGRDLHLGTYDTRAFFRKRGGAIEKLPSIVEGPLVNLVHSANPSQLVISFVTDEPTPATVVLSSGAEFIVPAPATQHNVTVNGLQAGTRYTYRVRVGDMQTGEIPFDTAPEPGAGGITIAYTGDSREGAGGGIEAYMGVNLADFENIVSIAYAHDADLFLMGGDLVNGYTSSPDDFRAQLHAWKQAAGGFWRERPVYPAIGNHEALLRAFTSDDGARLGLDRWPYDEVSAEAIFAEAFVNPANGPEPSDPRRPPYKESVYAVQYGNVYCITFNNNYWFGDPETAVGGSPEGYIFQDQLDWIEGHIQRADEDPTVDYVLLFAQEPVFPNGGHVHDAMWYEGDNNVRAHVFRDGKLRPEEKGVIEVRNALVRMSAASPKVAAVLGSDEHSYHRTLIGPKVPVGDPARDDLDGDGLLGEGDEPLSPLADLKHNVWYLVSGGGGAPFYAEEPSPWNEYWKSRTGNASQLKEYYFYSSQQNIMIFHTTDAGISLRVYNPKGELLDSIDNLMKAK
jgi:hypothetical protein